MSAAEEINENQKKSTARDCKRFQYAVDAKQVTDARLKAISLVFLTGLGKSHGEHVLASHKVARSSCPLAAHGVAVKLPFGRRPQQGKKAFIHLSLLTFKGPFF